MSVDSGCQVCRELLGGYVLGALEPGETDAVDRHLPTCRSCAAVHADLAGIPALLEMVGPHPSAPEPTPADLEARVLSSVAAAARVQPAVRPPPRPDRRRRIRRRAGFVLAGGLAGAALALGVVALTGGLDRESEGAPEYVAALRGPGGAHGEARLQPASTGTTVRLRVDRTPGTSDGPYELWCVLDDGRWISAGTFRVRSGAATTARLTTAARLGEYGRLVVTRRVGAQRSGDYGPAVMQGEITL